MIPGEPTTEYPDHSEAAERRMFYAEAQSLLGAGADVEQVMRVAEWLHTGGPVLDPARLETAARVCASHHTDYAGDPLGYDRLSPADRAKFDGRAAQIVTAYLRGPR